MRTPAGTPSRRTKPLHSLAFLFLWLFVFTIPWENIIVLPTLGTISRVVGIVAFGIAAIAVLASGWLALPTRFHLVAIIFVSWGALSFLWSLDPGLTRQRIWTYFQLLMMLWLIWELAPGEREQVGLMQAYVLGAYVSAGDTFYSYLLNQTELLRRYMATGFDPNDLGLTLALGIPMAWYLATARRRGLFTWVYRLYVPVALLAILLTASRGAFLATLGALSIVIFTYPRLNTWQKVALIIVVGITIYAIQTFVPAYSWQRLATIQAELQRGSDLNYRRYIWQAGLELFTHHPILGVGAGVFNEGVTYVLSVGKASHNTFLSVLVEQGVIGLGIFAAMLAIAFVSLRRLPPLERTLWIVLLFTWMVGASSLTWEHRKATWFIFGLLVAHAARVGVHEPLPDPEGGDAVPVGVGR
jgi:O-antigen ligase